jgi:methionyl aminopeptidase
MLKLKNFVSFNSNLFKGPYLTLPKKFFCKSYDNKIKYNESLDINQILTVTPARNVPENIPRPIYVKIKNYQPSYLEKSFIKSDDLVNFKNACRIAAGAVQRGIECVKVGMCTDDIDKVVHDYIISQDAYPSAIGYMGFPKSVCTSVNEGK